MNRSSVKPSRAHDGRPQASVEASFANALVDDRVALKWDVDRSSSEPPIAPPTSRTTSTATNNRRFGPAITRPNENDSRRGRPAAAL
jgi:hypothetical protein